MKNYLFFLFLLLFLAACEKETDDMIKPKGTYRITSPVDGAKYTRGDTIAILVEAIDADRTITACQIEVNGVHRAASDTPPYAWILKTGNMATGEHRITAVMTLDGGTLIRDSVTFRLAGSFQLITADPKNVTKTSAVLGGSIELNGSVPGFGGKGVCWSSETDNPQVTTSKNDPERISRYQPSAEMNTDAFELNITDLDPNTKYYYRMFAHWGGTFFYGDVKTFVTGESNDPGSGSDVRYPTGAFVDERDGREYKWVRIDTVTWMAENLKYLPAVSGVDSVSRDKPLYYVYGYDGSDRNEAMETENFKDYGVLYNHPAAREGCPSGWHLPTKENVRHLDDHLRDITWNNTGISPSFDGALLREKGTQYWSELPFRNAAYLNYTGFSARGAGLMRPNLRQFRELHNWTRFWTNDHQKGGGNKDYYVSMSINWNGNFGWSYDDWLSIGLSVRCVKDRDP